jgi:hypothetical protein
VRQLSPTEWPPRAGRNSGCLPIGCFEKLSPDAVSWSSASRAMPDAARRCSNKGVYQLQAQGPRAEGDDGVHRLRGDWTRRVFGAWSTARSSVLWNSGSAFNRDSPSGSDSISLLQMLSLLRCGLSASRTITESTGEHCLNNEKGSRLKHPSQVECGPAGGMHLKTGGRNEG